MPGSPGAGGDGERGLLEILLEFVLWFLPALGSPGGPFVPPLCPPAGWGVTAQPWRWRGLRAAALPVACAGEAQWPCLHPACNPASSLPVPCLHPCLLPACTLPAPP